MSLISLGFYLFPDLSPECLLNFLWLVYFIMFGKFFQFMIFTFLENELGLCIFTHASVLHSKLQEEFFENLFSSRQKGWKKLWFTSSKFNQKIWRWTLVCLHIVWFVIFRNVMALQFCEYLSNSVVLSLLLLLCNYGNLTLKLHQKKIATLMKGGFL